MELHLGPKMVNGACGKTIVAGTIDQGRFHCTGKWPNEPYGDLCVLLFGKLNVHAEPKKNLSVMRCTWHLN
jgi:hypothetical protein